MPLILARIYEEDTDFKKKTTVPNFKLSPSSILRSEPSEAEKLIENL
jgi:hypothetical protein